jgi:protein-tyrosine kinase
MDKLQQALERARAERERHLGRGDLRPDIVAIPTVTAAVAVPKPEATFVGIRSVDAHPSNLLLTSNLSDNTNQLAGAYKMLRTRVLQKMKDHNWNSLAVVSPGPDDGKTFTAINLAIAIASDTKHTTLLVDFDLRRPSVAKSFGFPVEFGVDDCLQGRIGLGTALVAPNGYDKLVVLPAREAQAQSSELLTSERAIRLVKEIRDRYSQRIVIFDLPPVLGADDALAFTPLVDCALMVVGASHTRGEDLTRALEVLNKIPILGTVLNGSRTEQSGNYVY